MMSTLDFVFLLFIGLFLPYVVIKSATREVRGSTVLPPKERAIWSTIVNLALIGTLGIFTASRRGTTLFGPWNPTVAELAVGVGLLVALFSLRLALASWMKKGQSPTALYLRPRAWTDLPLWSLLSCCAGFFEEIVYRGVMYQILMELSGSVFVAVPVACALFGLVHIRQGYRAVAFITLLSACLHWLVISFGTLYMAMFVHAVYDFLAGVLGIVRAQKEERWKARAES